MTKRFYRPELDAVRFAAFLLVFFSHTLVWFVQSAHLNRELITSFGFGLSLFLVLSAYLITTLLLRERAQTGRIALPAFYKRRMLRIWPLYLLGLLVGVAIDAVFHWFPENRGWYLGALLLAGNIVRPQRSVVLHLWSISLEEQFYVLWPTVMKRVPVRAVWMVAAGLTAVSWAVTAWFGHLHAETSPRVWFNSLVEMQMFTTGALLAVVHARRGRVLQPALLRVLAVVAMPAIWWAAVRFGGVNGGAALGAVSLTVGYAAIALSCAALIDAVTGLPRVPKPVAYLGRISFGLYVYHSPVMWLVALYTPLHRPVYLVTAELVVTIGVAALSYRYFEMPFLRWKERFEIVKSRPVTG